MRRYLSWIEGLTTNQNVTGSNPVRRTTRNDKGRQSRRLTALLVSEQPINNGRDFANTANSAKRQSADTIGQRMPDNQIPLTLEWLTCHGTHSDNALQARAPSKTHSAPCVQLFAAHGTSLQPKSPKVCALFPTRTYTYFIRNVIPGRFASNKDAFTRQVPNQN